MVQEGGRGDGHPVLVHAGSPSSRHLYGPHLRDALHQGIRLFSYDRPGYGGSDAQPGRVVADCAADVNVIVDALGIERFAVWGISAGGAAIYPTLLSPPDAASLTGELAHYYARRDKDSLAPGVEGW